MDNLASDYYNHPIFNPENLRFNTPAMKKLSEDIHRWLWVGSTGGLITGASRVGKTRAIRALSNNLYTRGKVTIPDYYISIPPRDQRTITNIFRQLCLSEDLRVTNRDRADHLSNRIVHYIADRAVEADCRRAVLVVDEMQRLKPRQFDVFAEIYDKLLLLDVLLTVIFVGNDPQCWDLIKIIQQPKYAHIRGRFFNQGISFHGLTSKEQMRNCLAQYDNLRFPTNGPTYVEYFLPEAFNNGWRLTSLSSDIWRVFHEYQKNYHIESWGMKYFTATINTLLIDFLPQYGVEHFDDEMVHECVRISELIPSLVTPTK